MTALKVFFFFLVATVGTLLPLHGQGHLDRWNRIDILHYHFEIDLNDSTDIIRGKAILRVGFRQNAEELVLDLAGPVKEGVGMTVDRVLERNNPCVFFHLADQLRILSPSCKAGSERVYEIYYHGVPADGLIISENRFGDRTFFGDNWPNRARNWLPVVDHPSDKATVEFLVSAPEHYGIVSVGSLKKEYLAEGRKHSHWHMEQALSTKLMVIGVSPFAVEELKSTSGIPVSTWVYPQNSEDGFSDFNVALAPLDFFEDYIAPYPYSKLANVQSKTRYGGMENASCIFYHERTVNGQRNREGLFAHEIAHQWFGDAVSEFNWHHIWLSEGFATYLTDVYIENQYGRQAMVKSLLSEKEAVFNYARHKMAPVVDTTLSVSVSLLNGNSYDKAGWFLHMLRREVGDSVFRESIRAFYHEYKFGNALTKDFLKVVETQSGKDLKGFFNQWLYTAGHPILSMEWNYRRGNLQLTVRQHQDEAFDFSLETGIESKNGNREIKTLDVSKKEECFSIPLGKKPTRVTLDPDNWLLFEAY